ncbi:DUF2946 domain-containing protein [Burkholderia sp. S171]|uniref:DUF2946 domain-containing protein n=1 Tax=Burkholderia sp. S171 TaxID=1641860 RepID=UPI00131D4469|nr:DUF2946 domain-containing protein [Burkholderia sp. S171]
MFRRRLLKIGSILGLLAILMTSIAPTVSHALASHDRLGQALSTYCSADPAFSEAGNNDSSSHSGALHWQACAYCGLLAHFPILTGSAVAFAAAVSVTSAPLPVVREAVRALPLFIAAQPRAPPVFS